MPSIKDLKKRIASVKNTQQTTKAMKMVSAAKLRRAQDAIQAHRPYARRIQSLIVRMSSYPNMETQSSLLRREGDSERTGKRALLVLVSSDRGLCGGFNANVIKTAQRWLAANSQNYESIETAFVGKKAYDFFKTKRAVAFYSPELGGKVTFPKATQLAQLAIDYYTSGKVDEVKFIYNEFKNAVTQRVVVEDFLPLSQITPDTEAGEVTEPVTDPLLIVKPSPEEVLKLLLKKNFAIQAFRILLESQASEHGARMSAMENATKNAGEMIRKLSLAYNKQRQAGITKELLEIIAGSESQKG